MSIVHNAFTKYMSAVHEKGPKDLSDDTRRTYKNERTTKGKGIPTIYARDEKCLHTRNDDYV